jgi:serine/threonine protein kinase/Tfp pilus assembly protein PilF
MTEGDLWGTRVGHIRIISLLGKGGMGFVHAGFDERLQRPVALKALQEGRLDENAKARFQREARVLSQLKHPNICQIYDYLEGPDRDFLVLELIEGKNLDEVVASKPDAALKMRIARQLAEVLITTHAKNIIHRDLKPANVMVTHQGDIKVLDFGLAREHTSATDNVLTHADFEPSPPDSSDYGVTRWGTILGTLLYMSPEQARGEQVTTASDMYSYGLVLQELFTGKRHYIDGLSAEDQLANAKAGVTVAVQGLGRDLTSLINRLKDPAPSVRPTALDTVEWLDRIADKPRARRRRALAWGAAALLALVAVGMSFQAWRIRQEATRANQESESARETSEFLVKLFELSDPGQSRGESVTARELLDVAARDIDSRLNEQPLVKARLELTLAGVYDNLGLYDSALRLAQKSLELRSKHLDATDAAIGESLHKVGWIRLHRGEYNQAAQLLRNAAEIEERALGPEDRTLAETLTDLATAYREEGKGSDAEPLYLRALQIREKALGPNHQDVAESLNELAQLYQHQRRYAEAESLFLRGIAINEKVFGPNDPNVAVSLNNLALQYQSEGKYAQAEPLLRRAIDIDEKALGPNHPDLASNLSNLAMVYRDQEKYVESEPLFLRAINIEERALGPEHPTLATSLSNLGVSYRFQGKYAQAEPLLLRAVAIEKKVLGANHPSLANDLSNLARLYLDEGKYTQAAPLLLDVTAIREKAFGPDSPETASGLVFLAEAYQLQGKSGLAAPLVARALQIFDKGPLQAPNLRFYHAKALALAGRTAEARAKAQDLLGQGYRRKDFLQFCENLGVKARS